MPCTKRHTHSASTAHTPHASYPGRQPMRNVATPIVMSETTSVALRPIESPKCPKMSEPTGRARNATANVTSESSSATVGFVVSEKNTCGK